MPTRSKPVQAKARPQIAKAINDVRALVSALGRSAHAVEQETGLSNAQLFLLGELHASPGLTINELASRAMTRQSTVSILVRRLEERGLVRRERASSDARRVHARLTAKGESLVADAPESPAARLLSALRTLDRDELETLCSSLEKLLRALRAPTGSPPPLFEPSGQRRRRVTRG
jgi:DNA-binding MarR family transcriptional regulator